MSERGTLGRVVYEVQNPPEGFIMPPLDQIPTQPPPLERSSHRFSAGHATGSDRPSLSTIVRGFRDLELAGAPGTGRQPPNPSVPLPRFANWRPMLYTPNVVSSDPRHFTDTNFVRRADIGGEEGAIINYAGNGRNGTNTGRFVNSQTVRFDSGTPVSADRGVLGQGRTDTLCSSQINQCSPQQLNGQQRHTNFSQVHRSLPVANNVAFESRTAGGCVSSSARIPMMNVGSSGGVGQHNPFVAIGRNFNNYWGSGIRSTLDTPRPIITDPMHNERERALSLIAHDRNHNGGSRIPWTPGTPRFIKNAHLVSHSQHRQRRQQPLPFSSVARRFQFPGRIHEEEEGEEREKSNLEGELRTPTWEEVGDIDTWPLPPNQQSTNVGMLVEAKTDEQDGRELSVGHALFPDDELDEWESSDENDESSSSAIPNNLNNHDRATKTLEQLLAASDDEDVHPGSLSKNKSDLQKVQRLRDENLERGGRGSGELTQGNCDDRATKILEHDLGMMSSTSVETDASEMIAKLEKNARELRQMTIRLRKNELAAASYYHGYGDLEMYPRVLVSERATMPRIEDLTPLVIDDYSGRDSKVHRVNSGCGEANCRCYIARRALAQASKEGTLPLSQMSWRRGDRGQHLDWDSDEEDPTRVLCPRI